MPWQNKICHCKAPVLSVGGVTSGRDTDGITSNMTEEDVVRELGCDNQEIKISLKKKTTLLLLLHSPSTLFSFLLYVSSSSGGGGGGGGGKSYLHRLSSQPPRLVLRHLPLSVQVQLPSSPRVSVLQPAPKHLPRSSHDSPILSPVL